ncbi:MAG: response regulator [Pseudomonadota bacterium]
MPRLSVTAPLSITTIVCVFAFIAALVLSYAAPVEGSAQAILYAAAATSPLVIFAALCAYARGRRRIALLNRTIDMLSSDREALADQNWELVEIAGTYDDMLRGSADPVIRLTPDGRTVFANSAFVDLFGPPEDMPISLETVIAGDGRITHDTPNGQRWLQWRVLPTRAHTGGRPCFDLIGTDVTEDVTLTEALAAARDSAQQASAQKSRFLAMMSHEIRTPMNGVLGMGGLLLDTDLDPVQRTYASAVRTSAQQLLGLIDDILDFSRIEAGHLDLMPRPTDIRDLVQDVTELLAPRAFDKGLDLAAHIAPDVPCQMMCDPDRFRQILFNLIGNAIKFTAEGGVFIALDSNEEDDSLTLTVIDTGIGFGPGEAERAFAEFEQLDAGPSRAYGGTGLGLAITRRIVDAMGGRISLRRLDRETHADVCLPLSYMRCETTDDITPRLQTDAMAQLLAGQHIAVASKRPMTARALAATLAEYGAELSALDDASVNLVITDGDVGLVRDQTGPQVPVLALLSPAERDAIPRLAETDHTGYLMVPVRSDTLLAQCDRLLARESPTREDKPATIASEQQHIDNIQAQAGVHVLVAEDNPINAFLTRAALERAGVTVDLVEDGAAAIERATDTGASYRLILMDVQMPGLDGLSATRILRDKGIELPIIALTASAFSEDRTACFEAGMDAVFTKPIDPDRLVSEIHTLLCGDTALRA